MAHVVLGHAAAELERDYATWFEGVENVVGEVGAVDVGAQLEGLAGEGEVAFVAQLDEDTAVGLCVLLDNETEHIDVDVLFSDSRGGVVGGVVIVDDMDVTDEVIPRSLTVFESE